MKRLASLVCLSMIVGLLASSCAIYSSDYSPPFKQKTSVILKENDFKYVERNLQGSYEYWALWLPYPNPMPKHSLQIPLGDPRAYSNALSELYGGSRALAEGKPSQLINWTEDSEELLFPFVLKRSVTLRADLIEFTK